MKLVTYFRVVFASLVFWAHVVSVIALPPGGEAGLNWVGDEPDEIRWDRFASELDCFQDFVDWLRANEAPRAHLRNAPRDQASSSSASPVWLSIPPKHFTSVSGDRWSTQNFQEQEVLFSSQGHHGAVARAVVEVPSDGFYRLWARYWKQPGTWGSFLVRLRDEEARHLNHGFQQLLSGDYLHYRFDFLSVRSQQYRMEQPDSAQFVWEPSPLVHLKAGTYVLDVAGCRHHGPFAPRRITEFRLTNEGHAHPEISASEIEARLWAIRPGAPDHLPPPPALLALWEEWKADVLDRLAETPDQAPSSLRGGVYFAEDINHIGTPQQIRERRDELAALTEPSTSWFYRMEAENMRLRDGPRQWQVQEHQSASGGLCLQAWYGDGLAEAETDVEIPSAGEYTVWLRHSRIRNFVNRFELRVERVDSGEVVASRVYGHEEAPMVSYDFVWTPLTAELEPGLHRVVLHKSTSERPFAYRHVDVLVITEDTDWEPERLGHVPPQRHAVPSLSVWQEGDLLQGFQPSVTPIRAQDVAGKIKLHAERGTQVSALVHVRNNSSDPVTLQPGITGRNAELFSWRLVAYILSKPYGWQPMPLLRRNEVTVPPYQTASLWIRGDARELGSGLIEARLELADQVIPLEMQVAEVDLTDAPVPLVGGWSHPYRFPAAWKMYQDVGINVIHEAALPRHEMEQLGIRLFKVTLGAPETKERTVDVRNAMETGLGLSLQDWAWQIFDEPNDKFDSVNTWIDAAKQLRAFDPDIRIWCNPGERASLSLESMLRMLEHANVFCPYINQLSDLLDPPPAAWRALDVRLFYTTPCTTEYAPQAPKHFTGLAQGSLIHGTDGWNAFSILNYYEYSNGPWSDMDAYHNHQAVSIFPGSWRQAIGSRNLEGIREGVRLWRKSKLDSALSENLTDEEK